MVDSVAADIWNVEDGTEYTYGIALQASVIWTMETRLL